MKNSFLQKTVHFHIASFLAFALFLLLSGFVNVQTFVSNTKTQYTYPTAPGPVNVMTHDYSSLYNTILTKDVAKIERYINAYSNWFTDKISLDISSRLLNKNLIVIIEDISSRVIDKIEGQGEIINTSLNTLSTELTGRICR